MRRIFVTATEVYPGGFSPLNAESADVVDRSVRSTHARKSLPRKVAPWAVLLAAGTGVVVSAMEQEKPHAAACIVTVTAADQLSDIAGKLSKSDLGSSGRQANILHYLKVDNDFSDNADPNYIYPPTELNVRSKSVCMANLAITSTDLSGPDTPQIDPGLIISMTK